KRILLDARVNNLFDELYTTFGFAWPDPVWIPAATRSAMVGVIVDW
ncbi:MAG: hypothetical protein GY906_26745, partial [bacterium]|nr:hypothetical protein [bacterium]MCP4900578.1 hypothetical protein [bacterium]